MARVIHPPAVCRGCGSVFAADTVAFVDLERRRALFEQTATCPVCHHVADVVPSVISVDPSSLTVGLIEADDAAVDTWREYASTVQLQVEDHRVGRG